MNPPIASDFTYRLQTLEERVKKLEDLQPAVLANEIKHLRDDLIAIGERMRATQIALWSLTGSFLAIAGSIIFKAVTG